MTLKLTFDEIISAVSHHLGCELGENLFVLDDGIEFEITSTSRNPAQPADFETHINNLIKHLSGQDDSCQEGCCESNECGSTIESSGLERAIASAEQRRKDLQTQARRDAINSFERRKAHLANCQKDDPTDEFIQKVQNAQSYTELLGIIRDERKRLEQRQEELSPGFNEWFEKLTGVKATPPAPESQTPIFDGFMKWMAEGGKRAQQSSGSNIPTDADVTSAINNR